MENAQQFYDEIKDALSCLGLRFSEMALLGIELHEGYVVFFYGNKRLEVRA